MKTAKEIADEFMPVVVGKTYWITDDKVGHQVWLGQKEHLTDAVKTAQIDALEWALKAYLNTSDDEKLFDKLQAKISELKGGAK